MAHSFGVTTTGFGSFSAFDPQTLNITTKKSRANVLGSTGNESASNLFNEMEEISQTYKAKTSIAIAFNDTDGPKYIGMEYNGYTLTSIALSTTADDYVTMTLTGHKHVSPNTHGTVRSVAHTITLASGYGADAFGCSASETNGVANSTCTITCQHSDKLGGSGNNIVGENFDPRISISVTATGNITIAAGYDQTEKPQEEPNTEHRQYTVTGEKALAFA